MIRFKLAEILKQKGWTPYRLAQVTGLTVPTAYRLAAPELRFGRFTADTLDRLCSALQVQPGDLLEWVPGGQDDGEGEGAQEMELAQGAR